MKLRRFLLAVLVMALALGGARVVAQQGQRGGAPADPMTEADRKIIAEVKDNNEVMANLEYLTDMIGPRLTGTDRLTQANKWTMQMFQKYGLANAHVEPWTIDIQTSLLICDALGFTASLLMRLASMQFQTIFFPSPHLRSRSTPSGTFQSLPAMSAWSWTTG